MNEQFLSEVSTLVALYGEPFGFTPKDITTVFGSPRADAFVIDISEEAISIINWYIFARTEEENLAVLDLIEEVKILAAKHKVNISEMEMHL